MTLTFSSDAASCATTGSGISGCVASADCTESSGRDSSSSGSISGGASSTSGAAASRGSSCTSGISSASLVWATSCQPASGRSSSRSTSAESDTGCCGSARAAENSEKSISSARGTSVAMSGMGTDSSASMNGWVSEKSGILRSSSKPSSCGSDALSVSTVSTALCATASWDNGNCAASASPGIASGIKIPCWRMASAASLKAFTCQPPALPAPMSSAQRPKACKAASDNCSNGDCIGFCSASQALIICSIDQAASPKSFRPTMRELPLSVWKALRSVVCSLRSPGSETSARTAASPLVTTSRASSRKMSSSSSSTSWMTTGTGKGSVDISATGMSDARSSCVAGRLLSSAASSPCGTLGVTSRGTVASKDGASEASPITSAPADGVATGAASTGAYKDARDTRSGIGIGLRSSIFCATASWFSSVSETRGRVRPIRMRNSPSSSS